MKIKRERLLNVLENVKAGISKNEIIEETNHFVFDRERVVTYNDQVCVIHPLKCGFICGVPSEDFHTLLKRLKDDLVILRKQGEDVLQIKTKTAVAELAVYSQVQILDLVNQFPEITKWKKLPAKFLDGIKWCMFSASRNASIPYLTAVFIEKGLVMATDELRVSMYALPTKFTDTLMIPAESASQLLSFKPVSYSIQDNWGFFKNEAGVIFCTRVITGNYPVKKYKAEFEFDGVKIALPPTLIDALDVTEVLAEGETTEEKRVDIKLKEGVMTVDAEKRGVGRITKTMKVKYKKKKAIHMTINPIFLKQILDRTNIVKIGDDRALFETGNFKHLVSLFVED